MISILVFKCHKPSERTGFGNKMLKRQSSWLDGCGCVSIVLTQMVTKLVNQPLISLLWALLYEASPLLLFNACISSAHRLQRPFLGQGICQYEGLNMTWSALSTELKSSACANTLCPMLMVKVWAHDLNSASRILLSRKLNLEKGRQKPGWV